MKRVHVVVRRVATVAAVAIVEGNERHFSTMVVMVMMRRWTVKMIGARPGGVRHEVGHGVGSRVLLLVRESAARPLRRDELAVSVRGEVLVVVPARRLNSFPHRSSLVVGSWSG